jgi:ABC-type polysaccharide/polyol phosphate export permease
MSRAGWHQNAVDVRGQWRSDVRELWFRRDLIATLAQRDLKLRYTQTALGVIWVLLQPLAGLAIFALVFGHLTHLPSGGKPYPVFVYAGLVVWTYISTSVTAAAESLVGDRNLITKVYFPRVVPPLAAVLPGVLDLAIAFVVLIALCAAFRVDPRWTLLTTPLWVAGAVLMALAVGLWLAALNAKYRDVRYAFSFALQIWFFASPIVFPSSLFRGNLRLVYYLNPLSGLLDGFRWATIGTPPPSAAAGTSFVVLGLLLFGAMFYFRRVERQLADRI